MLLAAASHWQTPSRAGLVVVIALHLGLLWLLTLIFGTQAEAARREPPQHGSGSHRRKRGQGNPAALLPQSGAAVAFPELRLPIPGQ